MRWLYAGLVFVLVGIMLVAPGFVKKPGLEKGDDFFPFNDDSSESFTPASMRHMGGGWVIKIGEDIRDRERRYLRKLLDQMREELRKQEEKRREKLPKEQPPRPTAPRPPSIEFTMIV